MNLRHKLQAIALLLSALSFQLSTAFAFEGRINAAILQDNQVVGLLYTVGTNFVRVELTASDLPSPVDILDQQTGALTLLFPHNRSFVHLKPVVETPSMPPGFPQMPAGLPPGVGPQPQASATPTAPAMPNLPVAGGMPAMPMMPMEPMELKATGEKTNLLGFACEKFEIRQRGEVMEIWATDQLLSFQNYVRNQTPSFAVPK